MTMLQIFNLLAELLAAAPGAEATVEQAIQAIHGSGTNAAKTQAVVAAAQQIATAGEQIIASTVAANTPTPTPPKAA